MITITAPVNYGTLKWRNSEQEVIEWLSSNIGAFDNRLFNGWRGEGWCARKLFNSLMSGYELKVDFERDEDAMVFKLRWL